MPTFDPRLDPSLHRVRRLPRDVPRGRDITSPDAEALRSDLQALLSYIRENELRVKRLEGSASSPSGTSFDICFSLSFIANADSAAEEGSEDSVVWADMTGVRDFYLHIKNDNSGAGEYWLEYWNGAAWVDMMSGSHVSATSAQGTTGAHSAWLTMPTAAKTETAFRVNRSGTDASTDITTVVAFFRKPQSVLSLSGTGSGSGGSSTLPTPTMDGSLIFWNGGWDVGMPLVSEDGSIIVNSDGQIVFMET